MEGVDGFREEFIFVPVLEARISCLIDCQIWMATTAEISAETRDPTCFAAVIRLRLVNRRLSSSIAE